MVYTADGFTKKNADFLPDSSRDLIKSSASSILSRMLNPVSQERKPQPSFAKRSTMADIFQKAIRSLISLLHSTQCSFIRCVKPNSALVPRNVDRYLVCDQIKSLGIIQTIEVLRAGYPTRLPLKRLLESEGAATLPTTVATLLQSLDLQVRTSLLLFLYNMEANCFIVD